jgi:hypothetical protein
MKVLLVKACEYATQQANGRQTLVGIFDNIVTPVIPLDHPPFFVCVQLEFEADEADNPFGMTVLLIDDDGTKIVELPVHGQVPRDPAGGVSRLYASFHVPGVRISKQGEYRLDVMINGRKHAEERIPVLLHSQALPGEAGA